MKKVMAVIVIAAFLLMSCATHVHTIGMGPQTGKTETATQWYVLYGLVPVTNVDTAAMAGGAANYEIMTQQAPLDIVISMVLGLATVTTRTVTVTL